METSIWGNNGFIARASLIAFETAPALVLHSVTVGAFEQFVALRRSKVNPPLVATAKGSRVSKPVVVLMVFSNYAVSLGIAPFGVFLGIEFLVLVYLTNSATRSKRGRASH